VAPALARSTLPYQHSRPLGRTDGPRDRRQTDGRTDASPRLGTSLEGWTPRVVAAAAAGACLPVDSSISGRIRAFDDDGDYSEYTQF